MLADAVRARRPSRSATSPTIVTSPPHVTVARSPGPRPMASLVLTRSATGRSGPVFHVTEVVLMESDTRRDGAVYHEVATFPLGG